MGKKRTFNHGDRDARRRRALERFYSDDPRCLLTGESNPHALQLHHVAGHRYHDTLIPISLTVHAKVSDLQKDHPAKIDDCTNPLEGFAHLVLGMGDLVEVAADDLRDPLLADFLMWLRWKLKELGLQLIDLSNSEFKTSGGKS